MAAFQRGFGPITPPGATTADNLPGVSVQDNTITPFSQYASPNSYQVLNPYARTPHTHYNAPQAYGLTVTQLRRAITGQIEVNQKQMWYTTDALPRVNIRGQTIGWTVVRFEEGLAEVVPYGGVPRILETSMSQETRSITRRAVAVFSEESYRSTEEGSGMYLLAMRHLATVVAETQNYDVVMAYFNCKNYNIEWELEHGYFNNKTIAQILRRELDFFAAIQRVGFAKLEAMVSSYHSRYGVEDLDMWILPREVRVFLGVVPKETTSYAEGGEQAVNQLKQGIGRLYDDAGPALIFGDMFKIYFTRTYIVKKDVEAVNPMVRRVQVGEYFLMISSTLENGMCYESNQRIIEIYDQDLDDMVIISLEQALEGISYMFDNVTGKILGIDDLVRNRRQHIANFGEDIKQHFLYRSYTFSSNSDVPEPIDVLGEMRQEHFSLNSQMEMAKSIIKQISNDMGCGCDQLYRAFSNGIALVRKVNQASVGSFIASIPQELDDEYRTLTQYPDEREFPTKEVTILPFDSTSGITVTKRMQAQSFVPILDVSAQSINELKKNTLTVEDLYPYMNNWAGLCYLADRKFTTSSPLTDSTQKTISDFVEATKKIVYNAKNILNGNEMFNKKYTLPYNPVQSDESVFLNHLDVFQNSVPVWVGTRTKAGESEGASIAANPESQTEKDNKILKDVKKLMDRLLSVGSEEVPYLENVNKLTQILYKFCNIPDFLQTDTMDAAVKDFGTAASYDDATESQVDMAITMLCTLTAMLIFRLKFVPDNNKKPFNDLIEKPSGGTLDVATNNYKGSYVVVGVNDQNNQIQLATLKKSLTRQELLLDLLEKTLGEATEESELVSENLIIDLLTNVATNIKTLAEKFGDDGISVRSLNIENVLKACAEDEIIEESDSVEFQKLSASLDNDTTLLATTREKVSRKSDNKNLELKGLSGEYARTSFTISYTQLYQYSKILESTDSLGASGNNDVPFITVSLPTTGFNKPATAGEIKDFLKNIPTSSYSTSSPTYLSRTTLEKIQGYVSNKGTKGKGGANSLAGLAKSPKLGLYSLLNPKSDETTAEVMASDTLEKGKERDILESLVYAIEAYVMASTATNNMKIDKNNDFAAGLKSMGSYVGKFKNKIPKSAGLTISKKFSFETSPSSPYSSSSSKRKTYDMRDEMEDDGHEDMEGDGYEDTENVLGSYLKQKKVSPSSPPVSAKFASGASLGGAYDEDEDMMGVETSDETALFQTSSIKKKPAQAAVKSKFQISAKVAKVTSDEELQKQREKSKMLSKKVDGAKKGMRHASPPSPSSGISSSDTKSLSSIDLILIVNDSTFGGNPVFNQNWENVSRMTIYELDKLMTMAILLTPVTKRNLHNFVIYNIILPMNFLFLRPHMQFDMAAGIKTRGGSDTGNTFVNTEQSNMMEGDSVETKERLTHYSYESKAEVTNASRVFIAHNIFCFATHGGSGTGFYTLEDRDDYSNDEHHYPAGKSIFVAPVPYEEREFPSPLDASGTFSHYTIQGYTDAKKKTDLHYSTAQLLNALFGFRSQRERGTQEIETWYHPGSNSQYTSNYQPKNTCCFRGPYRYWDNRLKRMVRRHGTGHFRSIAYAGCAELRNGGLKPWEDHFVEH